jgi:hypothetical protein
MPIPTVETWFMEGRLIPDYHYVVIKDDYSDLEEKIAYFCQHEDKARYIIKNANLYVEQLKDSKQELLISLLVMKKFFTMTKQL